MFETRSPSDPHGPLHTVDPPTPVYLTVEGQRVEGWLHNWRDWHDKGWWARVTYSDGLGLTRGGWWPQAVIEPRGL